jgi:hypothetical protein
MPIIAVIGGILSFIESLIGVITPATRSTLGTGILGSIVGGGGVTGVMGVITSVLGNLENEKVELIKSNLEVALAQIDENNKEESKANFFMSGWRPTLAWGLTIVVVMHCSIIEIINILGVFGLPRVLVNPLDTITVSMITGLLGMYGISRTVEKYNGNAD